MIEVILQFKDYAILYFLGLFVAVGIITYPYYDDSFKDLDDKHKAALIIIYPLWLPFIILFWVYKVSISILRLIRELAIGFWELCLSLISLEACIRIIVPLDLSPIRLSLIPFSKEEVLRFKNPLVLELTQDDDRQYLQASLDELGVEAYGRTREELVDDIQTHIRMLWKHYALASPDALTGDAQELRQKLMLMLESGKWRL